MHGSLDKSEAGGKGENRNILRDILYDQIDRTW